MSPVTRAGERPQVLLVEDERALRDALAYNLRRQGFDVRTASDGASGLASARAQPPDLLLLDVLLPGGVDGFQVCRLLRPHLRCPIILISALVEEVDRVVGLEVGADDYITKPFSTVELLARMKAHLRRAGMSVPGDQPQRPPDQQPIVIGDLTIDPVQREVRRGKKEIPLKRRTFDLLQYLARHAGITLSRSRLLDAVWPEDMPGRGDTRTVDVHIHRLREQLEREPAKSEYLHTVRGMGYVLRVSR